LKLYDNQNKESLLYTPATCSDYKLLEAIQIISHTFLALFWRQFHQHFTCAFLFESALHSFYLVTVWLYDFLAMKYKMLMKLTPEF